MSIVEIAENEATKANSNCITSMSLDVGTMAGIEYYALDTALEMAVKDTLLENASIVVNKIQARAKCADCNLEFDISSITDTCPDCNGLFYEVLTGKELKIRSIVVEGDD